MDLNLRINGVGLVVPEEEIIRLVQQQLAGVAAEVPAQSPPKIGARWNEQGGIYAGVARGRDGDPDYHLILNDDVAAEEINWDGAMTWAKGISLRGFSDYALPTRKEQALLGANVPEHFQSEYYWSCEPHASDADYAWLQNFGDGLQGGGHKSNTCRARAVRRLPIR